MYVKSIKEYSSEELYNIGVGSFQKRISKIGLADETGYVIEPEACALFNGELPNEFKKEILFAISDFENKLFGGKKLGEFVGNENNGHFLSLKLTFGSRNFSEISLPKFRNVGITSKTLFPYGDNVVLWTRDAYFNCMIDYMLHCKNMPLWIYEDIMRTYNSTSLDSILKCIEKADEWHKENYGQLYINTVMNDPYESVFEIIKTIYKYWNNGNVFKNATNKGCAVLIEPMYYGNKDDCSGVCIIDAFPAKMDIDLFKQSQIEYKGIFFNRQQYVSSMYDETMLKSPFKIHYPDDKYNLGENTENLIKAYVSAILQHELYMAASYGQETKNSVANEVSGIRCFFTIESGRAFIFSENLIPKGTCNINAIISSDTEKSYSRDNLMSDESCYLKEVIENVFKEYGVSILQQPNKFVSLLFDLAPQSQRQIQLIRRVLTEEFANNLLFVIKNQEQSNDIYVKKIKMSMSDEWLSDSAIEEVCYYFNI